MSKAKVGTIVQKYNANTKFLPPKPKPPKTEVAQITGAISEGATGRGKTSRGSVLSALIREVGDEVVEGSTKYWTRIEAAVRAQYAKALQGDTAAFKELTERGWGKIPTPVEIDVNTRIQQLTLEARFDYSDIMKDPILRELLESTGLDEEQMKRIQPPTDEVIDGESKPHD